jgi:hypothetical protein
MASPSADYGEFGSVQRLWGAIEGLSPAQLNKLKRYAKLRLRTLGTRDQGREWEDLLHDAVLSIASGRRRWPQEIDLFTMLRGAIRSLTDGRSNHESRRTSTDQDSKATPILSTGPDPERIYSAREEVERLYSIFIEDSHALKLLDGWSIGLTGPEIRVAYQMSDQTFDLPRLFQPVITEDFRIAANSFGVR